MLRKNSLYIYLLCLCTSLALFHQAAADELPCPSVQDQGCIFKHMDTLAAAIESDRWRDQAYRELAKSMAERGLAQDAVSYIAKIANPDTKAMTIRGIAMAAAGLTLTPEAYQALFGALRAEAEKIEHPPSYGIALTYIAMAQAFAGDDAGATQTAKDMGNPALRNKAFGETAEIQAEFGKFDEAMQSITLIEDEAFRNKAFETIAKIFTDQGYLQEAYNTIQQIENPVRAATALQYLIDTQTQTDAKAIDAERHTP